MITATPISDARTTGERMTQRRPAVTPPFPSSARGSTGLMRRRKKAEPRNESASVKIANGAVSSWVRMPPRDGPTTNDIARLP